MFEKFLNSAKIDVAAIEWIESENGKIYVYDVNTNTNYNPEAEKRANLFAHEHLALYLQDLLKTL